MKTADAEAGYPRKKNPHAIRIGLEDSRGVSAVWLCTTVMIGSGEKVFAASPLASRAPVYRDDYTGVSIHVVRVPVLDGKPNAHVWQVNGIGEVGDPTALVYIGMPEPDQRKRKDFLVFCEVDGLRFVPLPVP